MPRFNPIHTNYTTGEWAPQLAARVDVSKYQNAVALAENFLIQPEGGLFRRPGTYFAAEVKDSADFTSILPFQFNAVQAYTIEAGDLYFRFYKNNGRIESPPGTPYEIVSPYSSSDIGSVRFFQSNDQLFLLHNSYHPKILSRFSDTNWTITDVPFVDGPYMDQNQTATTIAPSATTGAITLTASTSIFAATDVGRHVRIKHSSTWGWAKITAYTSGTLVNATVQSAFGATTAQTAWRLGAFSGTTGYPSCGTFHQQRMFLGNTTSQPSSFFASRSDNIYSFAPTETDSTVIASNGFSYAISSTQTNAIRWFETGSVLLIGTTGAEWRLQAASTSSPLSPTNIDVNLQTTFGSNLCPEVRVGWSSIFVQFSGRKVKELTYDVVINGFQGKTISLTSKHLPIEGDSFSDVAYQQEPNGILWFLRSVDGRLVSMTYEKEQEVVGCSRCTIGGEYNDGNAIVEDLCVIPTPSGRQDQLWLIVKRTIDGSTKRYVEYLTETIEPEDENDKEDLIFVDSTLTYDGAPTRTFTGLDHLEGQEVVVYGDGKFLGNYTVASGSCSIPNSYAEVSKAHIGLAFETKMKSLPPEGGGTRGTAQAKTKRVHHCALRLYKSLGFEISSDNENWYEPSFRDTSDNVSLAPPLFTGDFKVEVDDDYNFDGIFYVRQLKPYPLNILGHMLELQVNNA